MDTTRYKFFQHRDCEFFPCHPTPDPDGFNCLMCYCPLYFLDCGGNYTFTEKGIRRGAKADRGRRKGGEAEPGRGVRLRLVLF